MNEIFARRSIRKFLPTMVEDEKIEQLLRAGMAAPSAGNQQPWEFYVVPTFLRFVNGSLARVLLRSN